MRTALCLVAYLIGMTLVVQGQDGGTFVRDSIHGDRGISGTLDFEPETRTYFPRRDEQGRVLEQEIHQIDNNGQWRPQSRRLFAYEDDQVSQMHIQVWNVNRGEWQDLRKDDYSYENGLLVEFVRQQISQGQLTNDRRWTYSYNEEEQETGILLQQWNGGDWENLSRKVVEYNQAGEMTLQTLQLWVANDWRNVRCRQWDYELDGGRPRVTSTTIKIWSVAKGDWIDQSRQLFFYNAEGLWSRSRFENWNEETQQWENADRMLHLYNAQNQPIGQYLQTWSGDWENRGRVNYSLQDNQFLSRIETWDKAAEEWTNFLRYRVEFDDRGLLQSRTGMQAWNSEQMAWENRNFTQRFTHFWSEAIVNSLEEASLQTACVVPNPYPLGAHFFCDLPPAQQPYQLELYDLLGRPVYRQDLESGQAASIDRRPAPGVYVLRIHDQRQLFHLQRLVIH